MSGEKGVEHGCFEVEVVVDPPEDHVQLADDQLEQIDLGLQHRQDLLLDGVPRDQVGDQDVVDLPDPVQSADPLLDLHRIPRQIDVDHDVAELQIPSLTGGFGAEQDRRRRHGTPPSPPPSPCGSGFRGRRPPGSPRAPGRRPERPVSPGKR